jgi:hypothetical protein
MRDFLSGDQPSRRLFFRRLRRLRRALSRAGRGRALLRPRLGRGRAFSTRFGGLFEKDVDFLRQPFIARAHRRTPSGADGRAGLVGVRNHLDDPADRPDQDRNDRDDPVGIGEEQRQGLVKQHQRRSRQTYSTILCT